MGAPLIMALLVRRSGGRGSVEWLVIAAALVVAAIAGVGVARCACRG